MNILKIQAALYQDDLQSVRADECKREVSMASRNKRELIKREKGKHLIYFLACLYRRLDGGPAMQCEQQHER